MKYRSRPDNTKRKISHVWEVHLAPETVSQIRDCAGYYRSTMSWIVRFCVLKLARKRRLSLTHAQDMALEIKEKLSELKTKGKSTQRFILCLYGEDERILRTMAIKTGLTVSMIIRIALARYLGQLSRRIIPEWRFFWFGIKLCQFYRIFQSYKNGLVVMEFHNLKPFNPDDYWKPPPGPLPKFLTTTLKNANSFSTTNVKYTKGKR